MGEQNIPEQGGRFDRSDGSDRSVGSSQRHLLRASGGYRKLRSFQVATVIYDATVRFCEQLGAARIAQREKQRAPSSAPACPLCGKPLVLRTARKGSRSGSQFWGCSGYPACKGTLPLDGGPRG